MSARNQFGDDATSLKRDIEAAYSSGSDKVIGAKGNDDTVDSPLCGPPEE